MAQIIPQEDWGERLGKSLGEGLSGGLGTLAKVKIQDLMQRQEQARMGKAYKEMGLPEGIAALPPQVQKAYMSNIMMERPDIFGLSDNSRPQEMQMQSLPSTATPMEMVDQLNTMFGRTGAMDANQGIMEALRKQLVQQAPQEQQGMQQPELIGFKPQVEPTGLKYNIPSGLTRTQRATFLKEAIREEKKDIREAEKEAKPIIKDTSEKYKNALETQNSLKRMEQLISTGKLTRPRTRAFLNFLEHGIWGIGLDFHHLESPESQEFDKLSKSMLKQAKSIFGSRITDMDVKSFLKMVPDLLQTREGKRRIIYNMKLMNEGAIARKKAMDDIIQENGGRAPRNLEALIDKRAASKLDEIDRKLELGFQKKSKERGIIGNISHKLKKGLMLPRDLILGPKG